MNPEYYVGFSLDVFYPSAANVDCDSNIDIIDALFVAQYYIGIIINPLSCPSPMQTPTPTSTPLPTSEDKGKFYIYPETQTVYGGENFKITIRSLITTPFYNYIDFQINFDDQLLRLNEDIGVHGVEEGDVCCPVEVKITDGQIRVVGECPGSQAAYSCFACDTYYIHWIPAYEVETRAILDLVVHDFYDTQGETIGNPGGNNGYVNILYASPTPTPDPEPAYNNPGKFWFIPFEQIVHSGDEFIIVVGFCLKCPCSICTEVTIQPEIFYHIQ